MKHYVVTPAQFDLTAIKIIKRIVMKMAKIQKQMVFAIPGGRSVQGILASLAKEKGIPWKKIHFFFVDERLVPLQSIERNAAQAYALLLDPLLKKGMLTEKQIHPFVMDAKKPIYGVAAYTTTLKHYGGCFDLVLLGVGEDGHIASLFPHHPSIVNREKGYILVKDAPKQPCCRVSASPALLQQAGSAVLLFKGQEKENAYKLFRDKETSVKECPAKLVQDIADVHVICDFGG
ncbi:6-phosphogluconolactonase [Candidatus Woesearchaeota archaeon]|nr:6-phosphogluconolactonase [Candidatus Woesearchaeota archaeon]